MREEFEKMVSAGKLEEKLIDPLLELTNSGYCFHRSWGFGKITTVDTVFARFTIDFDEKPGHQMDLGFAAQTLKAIPQTHILARKSADLEGLRKMAALQHLELIKVVLSSFDGSATVDQIQSVLVPDVIADDWRKWWEAARTEMKKSGHFKMATRKSEPFIYQDEQVSIEERLTGEYHDAKGLKARIAGATEIQKNLGDFNSKQNTVESVIAKLNEEIGTHQNTQLPTALEAIFIRDELKTEAGLEAFPDEITANNLWSQNPDPVEVLAGIPAVKHKKVLQSLKEARPDDWVEVVLLTMNLVPAKQVGECAALLSAEGHGDLLKENLAKLINHHTASSELLLWVAKTRSDAYADILGPEVFRAMLTAMDRDQFNERKSNRLRDYILSDQKLLVELIESADLEVVKDLTRALQFSPVFDDMDKRSLLARIVKVYPSVQGIISGDQQQTRQDNVLIVSWSSLERRKNEYEDLVKHKIPANSKDIAIARSYGDLRENHEYKSAKEMQKVLMSRKAQLETDLARARGTDFANPRTDQVSVGTKVEVTDLSDGHKETFIVLGAWDSDPDHGVVSYLTPIAQAMLNKPKGAEIEYEMEGAKHRYRIDGIAPAPVPAAPKEVPVTATPTPSPTPEAE